ncbi:leucyl aminopeptidase family protein [Flavobacteriaceae bacterium M23B6Z8]
MIKSSIQTGLDSLGSQLVIVPKKEKETILKEIFKSELPKVFQADYKETQIVERESTLYILLGSGDKNTVSDLRNLALSFSTQYGKQLPDGTLLLNVPKSFNSEQLLALYNGFFVGAYTIKQNGEHFLLKSDTTVHVDKSHEDLANEAKVLANAQITCMEWLNKPANEKTGPVFAHFAKEMAKKYDFECKVLNREEARKEGLEAYLAVNRASEHDAAFIIMEYKHEKAQKKIGLVGKCVTFDTGGISIKPSQNLHYMKSDMGGATAVLGAFQAAAELGLPVHLIGILPATDNAVSEKAYLPSDVIRSHSGKTIEIIDTDAEGRMTLADGLSYLIKNYDPETILDLATLTGSAVRTFGYECAALFSKNEKLSQLLKEAGNSTGEKVWQLPMWDEYAANLHSDVADIKNYSGKPIAGAIDAAMFLENFTHDHKAWAHLDIAGVAFGSTPHGKDKAATGYGVHLLIEYMKRITT